MLAVAMQQAVAGTALGPQRPWLATAAAGYPSGPDLDQLLHLAAAAGRGRGADQDSKSASGAA